MSDTIPDDNDEVRALIIALRGGEPERCDFCDEVTPPEQLEPEEAGAWVCWGCLKKWEGK